jgi:hypothetical protein
MKINFHKYPAVDFVVRLLLTIIIISPVLYFSWDAVKGTSGSDYIESVVFILMVGFFWLVSYLFLLLLYSGVINEPVVMAQSQNDDCMAYATIFHDDDQDGAAKWREKIIRGGDAVCRRVCRFSGLCHVVQPVAR